MRTMRWRFWFSSIVDIRFPFLKDEKMEDLGRVEDWVKIACVWVKRSFCELRVGRSEWWSRQRRSLLAEGPVGRGGHPAFLVHC